MGIEIINQCPDEVVAELAVRAVHQQAFGIVHGGVYCSLVETVASLGAWLNAHARGQSLLGLENSTSFIRAVKGGRLCAVAKPITRGRRTQAWEVAIRSDNGHIAAVGHVRFICLSDAERASVASTDFV